MVKEEKAEEEKRRKAKPKAAKKEESPKETPKPEAKAAELETQKPKAESVAPEQKAEAQKPKAESGAPEHKAEPQKAEPPQKAEKPAKGKKRAASKKPATKAFVARGKRKESIARATITEGKGVIRLNSQNLSSLPNQFIREIIREPLRYVGPEANGVDISISVEGGGAMGQAQAARTAVANALALYFDTLNLREKFINIDRSLVVEDTRRVEPKKFRGPKARARFQKSYR